MLSFQFQKISPKLNPKFDIHEEKERREKTPPHASRQLLSDVTATHQHQNPLRRLEENWRWWRRMESRRREQRKRVSVYFGSLEILCLSLYSCWIFGSNGYKETNRCFEKKKNPASTIAIGSSRSNGYRSKGYKRTSTLLILKTSRWYELWLTWMREKRKGKKEKEGKGKKKKKKELEYFYIQVPFSSHKIFTRYHFSSKKFPN